MAETPDFEAITARQKAMWSAGGFNRIDLTIMQVAEHLVATADPAPGSQVLDVACGTGNAALVAARRFTEVVGLDFAPNLIETARRRTAAEGTDITFVEGDAQALPFEDASFDVVLSVFGVQFAPEQERAASELLRVTRPGGRIALANRVSGSAADALFGPAKQTYQAAGPGREAEVDAAMLEAIALYDRATDGTLAMLGDYAEVVAIRDELS